MTGQKKTILSGMRPTGKLHIGHLLGVLNNWVSLQDEYHCYFEVADWHALTSEFANTKAMSENIKEMVTDWLAAGLDPEKSVMFVQSQIIEHAELHLLLSMITPLPWLERCPTYKEQINEIKDKDLSNYGFLGYPVLQAADILIYKANVVPIGQDQLPHLELTREICRRFNNIYGRVFPEPMHLFTKVPKLLGTDGRKMSKSYNNAVFISDSKEEYTKKIKSAFTDPLKMRKNDPGHPDGCPIFMLQNIYSYEETVGIRKDCESGALGCVDCKKILLDNLSKEMEPIQEKRSKIISKKGYAEEVLREGTKKADTVAKKNMAEVRESVFGKNYV
ncbi:MAG: tryptophan--tRNA ligase [Candidatus Firestonebacteria bacterium RIFOXYC2_FULL_39_67]|nr:MAG: tryptophan--tRNA ligase [Candidatus Firestonebacteria bacterium RIFOXYD2_FULL_39_29]OGF52911.1 MAG: tryptophan--tRNA ligase [Candidatus Firestonebacteria bacterium RifOxyC12_full_39_7]OGF55759.1 MAG: tryptophan--tRNA ligase [Candidatus Firestonebacteria bacterium RIFOXYC2_FULL_39_67]